MPEMRLWERNNMPIFAPIQNAQNGMDAFLEGAAKSQSIFDSMMNNRLKQAEAQRQQKMAQLPFGGMNVPGAAGQVVGLEMMKGLYGENSPQYQQALNAFNLGQRAIGSRIGYQDALTGSMPIRYTTPQGRGLIEESNVGQGASPAGTMAGQPVVPGAPAYQSPYATNQEAADQYEAQRIKRNVPSTTLTSSLRGSNAEQTLDNINVDDLTHYSGLKGKGELIKDAALYQAGAPNEQYKKFQEALTNAQLLAKQYRQMMGDSITPTNQEALGYMTNPTSWILHPDVAKAKFNTFADTLRRENKMFKAAAKGNIGVYTGQGAIPSAGANNNFPEGTVEATKNIDGNNYVRINGEWHKRVK